LPLRERAFLAARRSHSAITSNRRPPIFKLESNPPGAEAHTSLGPGCKTPCSVAVPAPDTGFSVSYTLAKHQPATVQVNVVRNPGDFTSPATATADPNPVFAELQPAGPPPKAHGPSKKKKKPTIATPAAADSPFPDPNAPPATTPSR
jgi:hypothetical protein